MTEVFKGGLIYEFTEEPNNYGLVRVLPDGNVQLLSDFLLAQTQLNSLPNSSQRFYDPKTKPDDLPKCEESYQNLFTTKTLPPCAAPDLIHKGVKVQQGGYVELTEDDLRSPYKVISVDGTLAYLTQARVEIKDLFFMRSKPVSGMYTPFLETGMYGMSDSEDEIWCYESDCEFDNSDYATDNGNVRQWEWLDDERKTENISLLRWTSLKFQKTWGSLKRRAAQALGCSDHKSEY